MNVIVNNAVSTWFATQAQGVRTTYNTKCTEAANNDLSTWRNVGRGVYDFRASGDLRVVATKTGAANPANTDTLNVAAIYRHGTNGGKTFVRGAPVTNY